MANRRDFLKNTALLSGALAFSNIKVNATPNLPAIAADDEQYWKLVRFQFPLSSNKIYLNNGTMGPSPYTVLNEVQQEMLEIETVGRYGGYEDVAIKELSKFLNTKDTEITLTRNVTEGINIACWGFPLKAGDEVEVQFHETDREKCMILKKKIGFGELEETLKKIPIF